MKQLNDLLKTDHLSFFGELLTFRDLLHIIHLKQPTKSFPMHLALEEVYTGILPIVDGIVEGWMGIRPIEGPDAPIIETNPILKIPKSLEEVIEVLMHVYMRIHAERSGFVEPWIQNELDEISKILAIGLYKLKYLR